MSTAIGDGHDDDRRVSLPESVERVLGQVAPRETDGTTVLDRAAVAQIRDALKTAPRDSNLDRLSSGFEVDVLIDGTRAMHALLAALESRFDMPIEYGETLRLCPVVK